MFGTKKKLKAVTSDLEDLAVRAVLATEFPGDYSRGLVDGGVNVATAMIAILTKHGV